MEVWKYFFNDKPISEQEWYELVRVESSCEEQGNVESAEVEEQLTLF